MERLDIVKIVRDLIDRGMSKDKAISLVCSTYKIDPTLLTIVFKEEV